MPRVEKKSFDVVVLGGINSDFVVTGSTLPAGGQTVPGESFYTGPGGKGANQAVAAARLGARVALIGRVGDEARGRDLVKSLRRNGVDVRHVSFDPKIPTGAAVIGVDGSGEKQIFVALGANLTIPVKQIDEAERLIASAKVLLMQFEAPVKCVLRAAQLARKHGTRVILDPAPPTKIPARLFPFIDLIRPNADEGEQITGIKVRNRADARRAAEQLLRRGVRMIALESGDGGDLLKSATEELFLPRLKVKTVDATGAGDAFAGAAAVAMAEGMGLEEMGRMANAVAALSTTKVGAQEALPSRAELERFLRRR